MSYKRQLQAHYNNFINALSTISMPEWIVGRAMRASLLFFVVFMSVAYMVRINSASGTGYEINNLQKQVAESKADIDELNIQIADASSMGNIEKRLSYLNMVEMGKVSRYNQNSVVAVAK